MAGPELVDMYGQRGKQAMKYAPARRKAHALTFGNLSASSAHLEHGLNVAD